jgi:hypothetical protein
VIATELHVFFMSHILIIGGTHGGEPTGVDLVAHLQEQPISGVATLIAHPLAVAAEKRFLQTDLNRSAHVETPLSLEEQLAHELQDTIAMYDLVIDFHNTTAQDTTCLITNEYPGPLMYRLARALSILKIVIIPGTKNLISYAKQGVGVEIARNNMLRYSIATLHQSLQRFVATEDTDGTEKPVQVYQYVDVVPTIPGVSKIPVHNFEPLTTSAKKALGVDNSELYPIFYGEKEYPDISCMLVRKIG